MEEKHVLECILHFEICFSFFILQKCNHCAMFDMFILEDGKEGPCIVEF